MSSATGNGTRAFVALGSNLGDRGGWLDGAVAALRARPGVEVLAVSDWIETRAEGGPPGQGPYLNGALELRTRLGARELLAELQAIEQAAGRVRAVPNGPRTLDLDLLVFGDLRLDTPELALPHPRMHERLFVLVPLARLAPELWLARTGCSVAEQCLRLAGDLSAAQVPT